MVVFFAGLLNGDYVILEIDFFKAQALITLFAHHQICQYAGSPAISFAERMDKEQFTMHPGHVPDQCSFIRILVRELQEYLILE